MIATIAVPITTTLHSFSSYAWFTTTYLLGSSVSQALSGYLTDIFGRRKGLTVCYGLFALGILLCGIAANMPTFLAGRVLQGLGGGAICSITAYVETDLIPMERRPFIEGLANVCYGVVLALGGVYGAAVDHAIGWKWAFLVQLPVLAIDGIIVFLTLKVQHEKKDLTNVLRHIDVVGMICLLGAIVCFEFGLNIGSTQLVWSKVDVIAPLVIAGVCLFCFIFWELKIATNPVVPIGAVTGRTVGSILISTFLSTGCFVSVMFYVVLYLTTLGQSNIETGLRLIPLSICFALGSILTGWVVGFTHRYYFTNIALQVISALGYGLLCKLDFETPSWQPFFFLGILGIGIGGTYVTNLMGILTSIPNEHQATIQAVAWSVRAIGVASGLTISSVIFQVVSRTYLNDNLNDSSLVDQYSNTIAVDSPNFRGLSESTQRVIEKGYLEATHAVFFFLLAQAVLSIFVSLFTEDNLIQNGDSADRIDN
jgi:MFS family permease